MRLSDEKISHLTHVVLRGLLDKDIVRLLVEEGEIRKEMKRRIIKELRIAEDIDALVKKKILSYSRKIPEGSPEWEVLYQKFFNEEALKKGRI
ncbi:MAG: DUF507 family protein [Thermodesulfovibrionia bacterium]|nr:DUF507 family protein [Thermodesulfovibrionia bacterium]